MKPVGTIVYYTGDIANQDGFFTVISHRNGSSYDLQEIDGERSMLGVRFIADTYSGNCAERFVTADAREAYRDAAIAQAELAIQRALYLQHQQAMKSSRHGQR